MAELAIFGASWLMLFFSVFAILQTVGVNLLPGWSHSRVFLLLAVIAAVIGGNALV